MRISHIAPFAVSAALRASRRWRRAPVRRTTAALASPTNGPDEVASVTSRVHIAKSPQHFEYDLDGNQTLVTTKTSTRRVPYNGENRPILWENVSTNSSTLNSSTPPLISMSFDRMGRRVSYLKTRNSITNSHKVFTYDGYLQIANSELTAQDSQLFIWDPTEPVATRPLVFYNSDASPQYYTHDGNKNVSDITDATQSLSAHYSYTPFGALLSSSGSSSPSNPFRFSSEYADDALGLVYYNYRHYNPEIGRWSSRDPLEEEGGANIYLIESFVFSTDFLGSYRIRNNCNGIKVDIEAAFFKISQKIVELLNTAKAPNRATKIQKKDASDNRKSIVGEISSTFAVLGIKTGERWRNFGAIKARLSNILAQSQRGKGVSVDCCPDRILGSHPCNMPMNTGSAAAMHKGVLYLCAGAIEDPEKYGGWDCLILHELLHLELPPINSSNFGTRQGMNIEKLNVRL